MSLETTCKLCGGDPGAVITASWGVRIDRDAPSQNVLATNSGKHRWSYKKERDAWYALLVAAARKDEIPLAAAPRRVTFTRCYSGLKKLRDHANVIGGMKPVVDAMVRARLLVDDSPEWFEGYYKQIRSDRSGTIIRIEELQ